MGHRWANQEVKAGNLLKLSKEYNDFRGSAALPGDVVLCLEDDDEFKLYLKVLHDGNIKWILKECLLPDDN
jgi:hypothetical protein